MIDNIDEAISHAREVAEEQKKQGSICCDSLEDTIRAEKCLECAKEHEQLAEWLEELRERRDAVKKLEESAEYYKDSLFSDGICFALKVISEPTKRDWENEDK